MHIFAAENKKETPYCYPFKYIFASGVASTTLPPTTMSTPSQVPSRQKRQVQASDNQTDTATAGTTV